METQSRLTIAEQCARITDRFTALIIALRDPSARLATRAQSIQDELSRFKCWSSNMGALHLSASTASLDFRLEVAPQLRRQVSGILDRLYKSVERSTYATATTNLIKT